MHKPERVAIRIKGIVQGVGFRPFIFTLAHDHGLTGWVTNDSNGVLIEVEGSLKNIKSFQCDIPVKVPPLARIDSIESWSVKLLGAPEFVILSTDRGERVQTLISPDMSICQDCLQEMMNPKNRRYLYPFINCTNCGPRFTIINKMPYDRPFTTMSVFAMCPECQKEYENPRDRRFHAQPNACPVCGPQVWLTDNDGRTIDDSLTIKENVAEKLMNEIPKWARPVVLLKSELALGKIAAVKGLGGYHLVCDACNRDAVQNLRKRKHRSDKPLAVMIPDLDIVRKYCEISVEEERLLLSPSRPIVLLHWKEKYKGKIALEVAPNERRLGVMLPYTPLHYMLFDDSLEVLVMTSGNMSGEPIIYDDQEVVRRLGGVADYFLVHNRKIVRPCDDSLQRVDETPIMLRRSRGYAPMPLSLKTSKSGILGCGGELKNTFALACGEQVFLSQHIGDLKTRNSFRHYRQMIDEMVGLFEIQPEIVAYDLHPEYLSTKYALERYKEQRLIGVQHHHAHLASCMAEHELNGEVIGLAFDGTGYGLDGKIWGGEVFITSPESFMRWAHLMYLPLPGGEQAILEPWRIGAVYLEKALPDVDWIYELPFWQEVDMTQWNLLKQIIKSGIQTPESSSMGRLFDGIAAILGIKSKISYEGQAAIELEEWAGETLGQPYAFSVIGDSSSLPYVIDPLPMIAAIANDVHDGIDIGEIARRFHGTVVEMACLLCVKIREELGLTRVVMSGGVFQNRLLSLGLKERLLGEGFEVYHHCQVPANDGGLALGQVYVANQLIQAGK